MLTASIILPVEPKMSAAEAAALAPEKVTRKTLERDFILATRHELRRTNRRAVAMYGFIVGRVLRIEIIGRNRWVINVGDENGRVTYYATCKTAKDVWVELTAIAGQ